MLARVVSGAVLGIDAYLVTVEADVSNGLPSFSTVGLAQGAVKEGRERVVAAVQNSGYQLPPKRITINLAPADIRKEGSAFDLPIAVGILAGTGQISASDRLSRFALLGELGLDGSLRPVRGVLPLALAARAAGLDGLIVPLENVAEAAVVDGIEVRGAHTLGDAVLFLEGRLDLLRGAVDVDGLFRGAAAAELDFADVQGQGHVKRALEVAAAGSHNILMSCRKPRQGNFLRGTADRSPRMDTARRSPAEDGQDLEPRHSLRARYPPAHSASGISAGRSRGRAQVLVEDVRRSEQA